MLCPKCRARMETVKTLPMVGAELRQRRCTKCHYRFTTQELPSVRDGSSRAPSPEMLFRLLNAQRNREWRERQTARSLPPPPSKSSNTKRLHVAAK
jgi:transposase-like protein